MSPSESIVFAHLDKLRPDGWHTAEDLQEIKLIWDAVFSVCRNAQSIAHTIEILIFLANDGPATVNSAAPIFGKSVQTLHPKFIRALESGLVERYRDGPNLEWHYRIVETIPYEQIFDAFVCPL
jgi:hypothetical protein